MVILLGMVWLVDRDWFLHYYFSVQLLNPFLGEQLLRPTEFGICVISVMFSILLSWVCLSEPCSNKMFLFDTCFYFLR